MGGRLRARALSTGVLLSLFWTETVLGQTSAATPTAPSARAPTPPVAPGAAREPSSTAAFPTAPPAATVTPAPTAAATAELSVRKARVRFRANEPGALLESDTTPDGRTVAWYVVCQAPCTATVNEQAALRVGGWGYHPSRPFRVPDGRTELAVDAEMERSSLAVPIALTVTGGTLASFGGLLALSGYAEEEQDRDGEAYILAGSIIGATGIVVATVGIVMLIVQSQHTESKAHMAKALRGVVF